jgi:hippurate hydrolase
MDAISGLSSHAVTLRHDLHRHPELLFQVERTARVVRDELDRLGISWRACAGTGTIAELRPDARGQRIALRADLDALPLTELTGLPWASTIPGRMHACGHDGHTASLLAAAGYLQLRAGELPGPVRLIFQPAEEGGHGALRMIEDGALEGVAAIYGYHNWPPSSPPTANGPPPSPAGAATPVRPISASIRSSPAPISSPWCSKLSAGRSPPRRRRW